MVDRSFEMELDRCFAEAPILPDAELFAFGVTERLDRGWTFRQFVIGGLGLAGGVVGAAQLLSSGVLVKATAIGAQVDHLMRPGVLSFPAARGLATLLSVTASLDHQVLWMSAALAALAVGLFVTRAIREF
jgi:hypothetical protein